MSIKDLHAQRVCDAAFIVDAVRQLNQAEDEGDLLKADSFREYLHTSITKLEAIAGPPQPWYKRVLCALGLHGGPWYGVYRRGIDNKQTRLGIKCACGGQFIEEGQR